MDEQKMLKQQRVVGVLVLSTQVTTHAPMSDSAWVAKLWF